MLERSIIEEFLAQKRLAVVGVTGRAQHFGATIVRELRGHGYEVAAVGQSLEEFDGEPCYHALADVPGPVDGVVIMVGAKAALDVIDQAAEAGIRRVWLFKGLGSQGAFSEAAVTACQARGIEVVEGACPIMFLEPVGSFHKIHRFARRLNGSLPKAAPRAA